MVSKRHFVRPTITTHTSVASQSTELSAASATTMVIASNSVAKTTLAGQVTLSVQDIDFTSPAAMQLILNDLMGEYMIASDNLAADNLLTAATSSGVWDLTVADLLKSVYDSAVDISNGRNWTPTHMFVSPDVWGQLGQLGRHHRPSSIPIHRRRPHRSERTWWRKRNIMERQPTRSAIGS
jgi:hypothetical protein